MDQRGGHPRYKRGTTQTVSEVLNLRACQFRAHAWMEANKRGPSTADCSYAWTAIVTASMGRHLDGV